MSDISLNFSDTGRKRLLAAPELLAALAAVFILMIISITSGFPTLSNADGDNDSVLRLTQIRDLMAGQSWFDLTQYRLGPEGGVLMHWSRLVDAPIAGLIMLAKGFGASQQLSEMIAMTAWPAMLLATATWLIVRIARATYGDGALFPAAVIGVLTLIWIGIFGPGRIDHHNLQLVLSLAMVLGLIRSSFAGGVLAGCCAALSLAIGMETLPFVALGGATSAILYLVRGERDAPSAAGFGLGFAAAGAVCFVATVPRASWFAATCDAYSVAQASVASLAGLGLFAIARIARAQRNLMLRAGAMAALGGAIGALVISQFPQCLADPYASLDPRLKTFWLDHVVEAQSLLDTARSLPGKLLVWYVTPAIALAVLTWRAVRTGLSRAETVLAIVLAGAYATSIWQIRGGQFAVPLATVILAGWVERNRKGDGSLRAGMFCIATWLLSLNVFWTVIGVATMPDKDKSANSREASGPKAALPGTCYARADYADLGALPGATVLAISNLGSGIITYTHHRALAGPYHRNVAGNLAVLDTLLADPQSAMQAAAKSGANLIAVCRGNPETKMLAKKVPGSLLAALVAGKAPSWLHPVAGNPDNIEVYTIAVEPPQ